MDLIVGIGGSAMLEVENSVDTRSIAIRSSYLSEPHSKKRVLRRSSLHSQESSVVPSQ